MSEEQQVGPVPPPEDEKLKVAVLKAQAVRQAMFEVMGESRAEIVRRARAKLVAMGVAVSEADFGGDV